MKHVLIGYAVVLVVLLMVSREFEAAGWAGVGALGIAAAVVNAFLVLAVLAGLWLAGRLGLERWARSMDGWRREQAREAGRRLLEAEIIGVTSWRDEEQPAPLPQRRPSAPPSQASAGFTYVGPSYGHEVLPAPVAAEDRDPRS
ncbi:hypothetical protein [Blastococcus sp. CCUG 61487]|uniref:hypothetical protein n=1 Tax=Blastococcus sp. CCUG 61487 TaxID=1840703 RepID=UPI0010C14962|nr:hypothetical protein [Blastococcus sp. CCUG 61487]TKJ21691.1 hypothetical protein A6V29_07050 [Blastococcus sp. CCUG 61487]